MSRSRRPVLRRRRCRRYRSPPRAPQEHGERAGAAVGWTGGGEGGHVPAEASRREPVLERVLQDRHLILGVAAPPVNQEHAPLAGLARGTEERIDRGLRLVLRHAVEIDVALHRVLAAPEPPHDAGVEAGHPAPAELLRGGGGGGGLAPGGGDTRGRGGPEIVIARLAGRQLGRCRGGSRRSGGLLAGGELLVEALEGGVEPLAVLPRHAASITAGGNPAGI